MTSYYLITQKISKKLFNGGVMTGWLVMEFPIVNMHRNHSRAKRRI